jgi:hypothetical protein
MKNPRDTMIEVQTITNSINAIANHAKSTSDEDKNSNHNQSSNKNHEISP